jgi:predicted MFS family arabinose efflux permease
MFHNLVDPAGFGWATRSIAFVILGLSIVPIAGMRMRLKPPAVRRVFEASAWKEPHFSLYAMALFVGYMGMYIPFFYIQLYCVENAIIVGELAFYLLPIMNASSFFGRLVSGYTLESDWDDFS